MPRDLRILADEMERSLADRGQGNLHAQAHARLILDQLHTPRDAWPHFRADLDERLYYSAHLMIGFGLDLIADPVHSPVGRRLLVRGAEALEYGAGVSGAPLASMESLVAAAVAYHVAGHHARGYVLVSRLAERVQGADSFVQVVIELLRKDLAALSASVLAALSEPGAQDSHIAAGLADGTVESDDAIATLGRRSLVQAIALYIEYAKRGRDGLLDRARTKCDGVVALGVESRHADLWWWGRSVKMLLKDLGDASLWRGLGDLVPPTPFGNPITRYIESQLRHSPATLSLWPSQREALDFVKREGNPSFCVRMPTSAGKTKIAELAILRALLPHWVDPTAKCLYIAPYRSLAVEVESTLSRGLAPVGLRVSEIYGGFDLTAADEQLIDETRVLVATPEKFDAVIRLAPQLLDGVRLVVIDEGHIAGDISERGMRAEFLINRLLCRLGRDQCRHIFISAVLPNPAEFARWIGGTEDHVVESDWRPSRLVFGECRWDGTRVRLDFTHEGSAALGHDVFIAQFVPAREVRGIAGMGRRRSPFPKDAAEAFAAAVVRFAVHGVVLAFVPQARQVESDAQHIADALVMMQRLAAHDGRPLVMPIPLENAPLMAECLTILGEELGPDSEMSRLLRVGIAIHHGSLPVRVRVAVERLIRSGTIRIIVATTTLGQGVNLPIKTVLVRGMHQGQDSTVSPMTFWNIAGRAGRAMNENEGHVLFFNDLTRNAAVVRRQRQSMASLIDRSAIEHVIGLLHRVLQLVASRWNQAGAQVSLADLCMKLAEDDFGWISDEHRPGMQGIMALLDQHLLALAVEREFGPDDQDRLQESLRCSLLFAQLGVKPIARIGEEEARAILTARLRRVFARVPQPIRREQFYRMGFSLLDCERVETASDRIVAAVVQAREWAAMTTDARMACMMELAELALQLDASKTAIRHSPAAILGIVRAWISGMKVIDMAATVLAADFDHDPATLGRFIEDLCVYGLAWVISGFVSHARHKLGEDDESIPEAAEHFAAMFKLGVPQPMAAVLAPYLQMNRSLAVETASLCPFGLDDLSRAIAWLHNSSSEEFEAFGATPEVAQLIVSSRRRLQETPWFSEDHTRRTWTVVSSADAAARLCVDDPLLLQPTPERGPGAFQLRSLEGDSLGDFALEDEALPRWMSHVQRVAATVLETTTLPEDKTRLGLEIRLLGDE